MKLSRMSAVSAVLTLTLMAGTALAQGPHHEDFFGPMLGFMSDVLNLTDAQQAQIKQIHENLKPSIEPLMQQEHQSHLAMKQLITSGTFDQAKAQAIANQEAQIHAQLEVLHAQAASQAYQILTPEQKTQFNQMAERHEQRMEQHMQEHSQTAAPQP